MANKKLIYADDARRAILETEPKLAYCIERIKGVDAVEVAYCDNCVNHNDCWVEDTFRAARIDKPYCCVGKWKTNSSCGERKDNEC